MLGIEAKNKIRLGMDFCIDLHCLALNLKAKSKIRLQMDLHKLTVLLGIEAKGSPDPVRIITN